MRSGTWKVHLALVVLAISAASQRIAKATPGPNLKQYYWDNTNGAYVKLWPVNQGYCFLIGMSLGYASDDGVSVYNDGTDWYLGGTSSGPAHYANGTAACMSWPAGFSVSPTPNQWITQNQLNLTMSNCFCSISGFKYNGNTHSHTPELIIGTYPTSSNSPHYKLPSISRPTTTPRTRCSRRVCAQITDRRRISATMSTAGTFI